MQELMHIITEFPGWGVGKSRTYRSSGEANFGACSTRERDPVAHKVEGEDKHPGCPLISTHTWCDMCTPAFTHKHTHTQYPPSQYTLKYFQQAELWSGWRLTLASHFLWRRKWSVVRIYGLEGTDR